MLDEDLLSVTVNIGIYNTVTNEMIPLHSYTIPIEQTYIGGYLTGTSSIDMIWKPYFSDLAITTVGKIEADHVTHGIAITAPVLLNWRYWVDRFNLANIFGANATDNYRGYIGGDWVFGIQILTLTPVSSAIRSFANVLKFSLTYCVVAR